MNRFRHGAVIAILASAVLAARAPVARASAEVHKLSLVISGMPTSVSGNGFNDQIGRFNEIHLIPRGLEGLGSLQFGWIFDAQLHYFVRPNVAVSLGVGQLHTQQKREYLPALTQDVQIRAEILSVPVHAGADYYFTAYNQGDFQARAYLGTGVLSSVYNKVLMEQVEIATDSTTSLGGAGLWVGTRSSPGYYFEGGAHLFFASKFSVMLGAEYRSVVVRDMMGKNRAIGANGGTGIQSNSLLSEKPFTLDLGGLGMKMALAIGF